jgi:FixJ family two-component response regulator
MSGEDPQPLVCIVDDDDSVRKALERLVRSLGLRARTYASPSEFLGQDPPSLEADCLLLDVQLPAMSGFELYDQILESGGDAPVIFITGQPRPSTYALAEEANAVACLEKPFNEAVLVDAIREALRTR